MAHAEADTRFRRHAQRPPFRSWLVLSTVICVLTLGGSISAAAQAVDISVDPDLVAPGATVTVTVTGAPADETVVVRLGTEETTATTDASGGATVTIAAPTTPGEAIGTVRIGAVDTPIRVVVQAQGVTTTTTTTTPTPTTTTIPPPTTPPPVTGIEDAGTLAGLGAALVAAGAGFILLTRRPTAATITRGSVTHYRLVEGRRGHRRSNRTR